MSKIATIVGSDKGGVGKSTISSLVIEAYDQAQRPLPVVEIDHQGKLRNSMGDRVTLTLRASLELEHVTRDRYSAERFYNPVYEIWRKSDSLTDLGANVTTQLFDWMNQCHVRELAVEDDILFRFVAVATPDDQALRSAFNAISTTVETLDNDVEMFLILNEVSQGSGFAYCEQHPAFRELLNLRGSVDLKILKIPFCDSDLMDYGRAHALSPLTVFKNTERLCEEMQLSRVAARTEKRRLLTWISEVQESLQPLFVEPSRLQAARPQEPAPREPQPAYRADVRHEAAPEAPRREARHFQDPAPAPRAVARDFGRDRSYDEPPRREPHVTDAGALVEQLRPADDEIQLRDRHPLRPVASGGTRDYR